MNPFSFPLEKRGGEHKTVLDRVAIREDRSPPT